MKYDRILTRGALLIAVLTTSACQVPDEWFVGVDNGPALDFAQDGDNDVVAVDTGAPIDVGPLPNGLTDQHTGFKQALCFTCHGGQETYPHAGLDYSPPDCAICHGYNGAPHKDHAGDPQANCRDCHSQGSLVPDHLDHFEIPGDCAACHVQTRSK